MILATPNALKVEGRRFWFHLNHFCRAKDPGETARVQHEPERDGDGKIDRPRRNHKERDNCKGWL